MKTLNTALLFSIIFYSQLSLAGFDQLSKKEIRNLIGDFPAQGSQAELEDDEILLNYQNTRTKPECDFAATQEDFKADVVFVKPIGPLERHEFDRVNFRTMILMAKVGLNIVRAKKMYDRPRPYLRNPEIKPCIDFESSTSYPSGHTAIGRAVGQYLSRIFPDRAVEIMKVANQVGTNRVLGGVHHPSDVVAGIKIGDEVALRVILGQVE